jgi:hypothetical protein
MMRGGRVLVAMVGGGLLGLAVMRLSMRPMTRKAPKKAVRPSIQ